MKKLFFVCAAAALSLAACKKVEGEGGRASITGKVEIHEKLYLNGVCTDTVVYDGAAEDIYIIYGSESSMYNDKLSCSYDGTFKFSYLREGEYTVFGYSKTFHTGNSVPNNDDDYYTNDDVSQTVTIGKKEEADLGTIILWK